MHFSVRAEKVHRLTGRLAIRGQSDFHERCRLRVPCMNIAVAVDDEVRHEARPSASEAGPATKRIVVGYGFWLFLLSDIVMFSAIFAAYAVLAHATAGGPGGAQLFNQRSVAIETGCLLASSHTCGLMSLAIELCGAMPSLIWLPSSPSCWEPRSLSWRCGSSPA